MIDDQANPLVADMDHSISRAYGIEVDGGESYYPNGVSMRATFIIDKSGDKRIAWGGIMWDPGLFLDDIVKLVNE